MIKMCRQQTQTSILGNMNCRRQNATLFAGIHVGQQMVPMLRNRKPRQNGVAVLTALKRDVGTEDMIHSGESRQFGHLIHLARARCIPIHLLQRHQVRLHRLNHARNARHIQLTVHTRRMMDVVAQHPQPHRRSLALGKHHLTLDAMNADQPAGDRIVCQALPGKRHRVLAEVLKLGALLGERQAKGHRIIMPCHP